MNNLLTRRNALVLGGTGPSGYLGWVDGLAIHTEE